MPQPRPPSQSSARAGRDIKTGKKVLPRRGAPLEEGSLNPRSRIKLRACRVPVGGGANLPRRGGERLDYVSFFRKLCRTKHLPYEAFAVRSLCRTLDSSAPLPSTCLWGISLKNLNRFMEGERVAKPGQATRQPDSHHRIQEHASPSSGLQFAFRPLGESERNPWYGAIQSVLTDPQVSPTFPWSPVPVLGLRWLVGKTENSPYSDVLSRLANTQLTQPHVRDSPIPSTISHPAPRPLVPRPVVTCAVSSISGVHGHFGGNQLLDGSISLSPLYPGRTTDLHVRTAAGLHQSFLWLRPAQA